MGGCRCGVGKIGQGADEIPAEVFDHQESAADEQQGTDAQGTHDRLHCRAIDPLNLAGKISDHLKTAVHLECVDDGIEGIDTPCACLGCEPGCLGGIDQALVGIRAHREIEAADEGGIGLEQHQPEPKQGSQHADGKEDHQDFFDRLQAAGEHPGQQAQGRDTQDQGGNRGGGDPACRTL